MPNQWIHSWRAFPRPALASVVLAVVGCQALGQDLRRPEFMERARTSFEAIYNLDYDAAAFDLRRLRAAEPNHPAPPLYLAIVIWLKELFQREELDLDRFVAPGYFKDKTDRRMDPDQRQAFFDLIEESQGKCREILSTSPNHKDARYFLGSTHGILGSFAITIDRSVKQAFSEGKQAYKYHRELVDEDPEFYDAYMSVGLYEYVVGNLPWYIKWLATIVGYRGSEEQGFEYLDLAARRGTYVRDDARTLQMVLYIREKRPADALANARALHSRYSRNYLLHINQAQILEMMKEEDQAVATYQEILSKAEDGVPNYGAMPLDSFRYEVGRRFVGMGRSVAALQLFEKILASPSAQRKDKTLAHLQSGEILQAQDRHQEAAGHYRAVLQAPPEGESHNQARRRIKEIEKDAKGR